MQRALIMCMLFCDAAGRAWVRLLAAAGGGVSSGLERAADIGAAVRARVCEGRAQLHLRRLTAAAAAIADAPYRYYS